MPISPENKKLYPKNWKAIRAEILKRADNKCEKCGVINHAYYKIARPFNVGDYFKADNYNRILCLQDEPGAVRIVLTIAHLKHNPRDNRRNNLAALCQACHNKHDAKHRARNRRARREKDQLKFL